MEFPNNSVSSVLQYHYSHCEITSVTVRAFTLNPLTVTVTVEDEQGTAHTGLTLAIPNVRLDKLERWIQQVAWVTGANKLVRWANGQKIATESSPLYQWTWEPFYRRSCVQVMRDRQSIDSSLEDDGGRSIPCPMFEPKDLLEEAKAYPAHGSGRGIATELLFVAIEE